MKVLKKIKHLAKRIIQLRKERQIVPITQISDSKHLLEGKVVLITGGSSGIGFSIAEACVRSGAHVILAGRKEKALIESCKKIGSDFADYFLLDVTCADEIPQKIEELTKRFACNIDILVNSAGLGRHTSFWDMGIDEYNSIMDTNAKGTFFMSRAVAKHMIDNHIKGHILNLASSSSIRPAWTSYEMSKWAIRGLTIGLADILTPYGIVVNAIAPGPTATPMLGKNDLNDIYNCTTPAGRFSTPQEVANLAVFLISDMGNMIIGDTYFISGGSGIISLHR